MLGGIGCPGRFNPLERDSFPILYEAEWIPGTVWRGAPSPGFDPHSGQSVAGGYIGYVILVNHHHFDSKQNMLRDGDRL